MRWDRREEGRITKDVRREELCGKEGKRRSGRMEDEEARNGVVKRDGERSRDGEMGKGGVVGEIVDDGKD